MTQNDLKNSLCSGMEATTMWIITCIDPSLAVAMYGLQRKSKEEKKDFWCDVFHKDNVYADYTLRSFFQQRL